ncbi:uncharacterized protein KY384_003347 [Bacidia gigantensis]|uniref:uncharacterized protein n=1 Tax=Bacidia gigantensis TaxID=2732470 RepID=UPI001D042ACE|nr:uncharacterized protein KY384_003347 [Bacidia gigantensis]KAG8531715.1 hypothetical protein KY384_003347 [Bacidia gigantensis]
MASFSHEPGLEQQNLSNALSMYLATPSDVQKLLERIYGRKFDLKDIKADFLFETLTPALRDWNPELREERRGILRSAKTRDNPDESSESKALEWRFSKPAEDDCEQVSGSIETFAARLTGEVDALVKPLTRDNYIKDFIDGLWQRLTAERVIWNMDVTGMIKRELPTLFRDFALRLGWENCQKNSNDDRSMIFILEQNMSVHLFLTIDRGKLTECFGEISDSPQSLDWKKHGKRFRKDVQYESGTESERSFSKQFSDRIAGTASYKWLISKIVRATALNTLEESVSVALEGALGAFVPALTLVDIDIGQQTIVPKAHIVNYVVQWNPLDSSIKGDESQCWHGLFENPLIASGFLVTRRSNPINGLEIPLDVMANLIQVSLITWHNGLPFLKGFAAMAFPTRVEEGILVWHLISSQGERISYNDPRIHSKLLSQSEQLTSDKLESMRHILGWCPEIKNLTGIPPPHRLEMVLTIEKTGSPHASYSITPCNLERAHAGCVLEKVTIGASKYITGSVTVAIGKKDKAIRIPARDDYMRKLMWISKKFVVLFDVKNKTAWLVDGASALLHLVRSSISHLRDDRDFGEHCLFRWSDMKESFEPCSGSKAAKFVLLDEHNMQQKLFKRPVEKWEEQSIKSSGEITSVTRTKTTSVRFSDKVEHIYQVLEEIVAAQDAVASEDGYAIQFRGSPRRRLEGFDFAHIAEDQDPLYPHVHMLQDLGTGWVDFVRSLQVITLFGNDFGDLILPVNAGSLCTPWTKVPSGKDLLSVSISTAGEKIQRNRNGVDIPWRIANDFDWYAPRGKIFEPCQCHRHWSKKGSKPCDRVQLLVPAGSTAFRSRQLTSPNSFAREGAVIFGHCVSFPILWGDFGPPSPNAVPKSQQKALGSVRSPANDLTANIVGTSLGRRSLEPSEGFPGLHNAHESTRLPEEHYAVPASGRFTLQSFKQIVRRGLPVSPNRQNYSFFTRASVTGEPSDTPFGPTGPFKN